MLYQNRFPIVLIDDGITTTDVSVDALSFGRDAFACELEAAGKYLYFGRVKPFSAVYIEADTANTQAQSNFQVEYWNGTAWASCAGLVDETKGFTRSGFVQFTIQDDWVLKTVGANDQFYVRFVPSEDFSAGTTVQGMNLVFSDDEDLKAVFPGILNYKASTEATFILRHQAARDRVMQDIRNRGFRKQTGVITRPYASYEAWDVLHIEEANSWAIYLALENIFSSLQSTEDGLYKQKAEEYRELAGEARAAFWLTLDKDDDGKEDANESAADISTRRLVRR